MQIPWSPVGEKSHTLEIGRDDILTLPVADWARKPELLKTAFFGLRRDLTLLDKLSSKHVSLGKQLRIRGTRFRGGLKIGNRSRDSTFLHELPLLKKDDVEPFRVSSGLQQYEDTRAQWPRSRDTYRAPLLLVREFLEPGGRVVSAVAERDLVFTDAFFAAALPREESDLAYALAAILKSSLASWFLLMTGSTFGLWMQRLLLRDVENMPVPRLDELVGTPAGRRLIDLVRKERTVAHVGHDWREMDEAVFDLYGLDDADRIVAKDGLIRAGWEWKSGRIESAMAAEADPDIVAYADIFLAAVDAWISTGRRRMRGEVFGLPVAAPHRVVRFVLEDGIGPSTNRVVRPEGSLRDVLERIGERMDVRIGESLVGQRTLRVYGPDEVVIIKPAARRHWMGGIGARRCRCRRRGQYCRIPRVKLPTDVPAATGRPFIDLAREIVAAIMRIVEEGWNVAVATSSVAADDGEVEMTERLRDGMRETANRRALGMRLVVLPGTESRSGPGRVRPDGRTDVSILVIEVFLRFGDHDPHAIIECKRSSSASVSLAPTRDCVASTFSKVSIVSDRGNTAQDMATGFMIGYLVTGSANGCSARDQPCPECQVA